MHRARKGGGAGRCGASMPSPGATLSQHSNVTTIPETLQTSMLEVFMEASSCRLWLIKSPALDQTWSLAPFPFRVCVWEKFQSTNHGLMTSPQPETIQDLPGTSHLKIHLYPEIPRVLGAVCQEPGTKPKYLFFIVSQPAWHQTVKVFGNHFSRRYHERGKTQNPWRIRVMWWMNGEKVKPDSKISCYSHGCKQGISQPWNES